MEKISILNRIMEAGNHFKNGASSKSRMSRENIVQILIIDNECCTENMRQLMSCAQAGESAVDNDSGLDHFTFRQNFTEIDKKITNIIESS